MGVKVRLTDKNFFQSPFVIGSRLNEAEGDINQANAENTKNQPSAVDVFNWTIMKNFANMLTNCYDFNLFVSRQIMSSDNV